MSRWPDRWIVPCNWPKFQARRERPGAPWIKNWLALLHKPEYLDLPLADRGLLHAIWLAYADADGRLRSSDVRHLCDAEVTNTRRTPEALRMFVTRSLDRLNRAGFIEFFDDKPLPLSLNTLDARARDNGSGGSSSVRRAETWIANGAAAAYPPERLADVIAEDFGITDPAELERLVGMALP